MKAVLKRGALWALTTPPVYGLLRRRAFHGNPVTILCYHTLRPAREQLDAWTALSVDAFRAQINLLRQDYDIVSLDEALAPATSDRRRVVLTFDDGELGLYEHLLPIVQAEALPVTVYVATKQIETGRAFWFDRVMNALQSAGTTKIKLDGIGSWQIGPDRSKLRWAQIGPVLEALKAVNTRDRDALADKIIAQTGQETKGFTPLQPMSLPQLQELSAEPLVTIGSHTHSHELLDQISLDDAGASVARSRDLLQGWTGQEIRHFAYPNGNYTPDLMKMLYDLGFVSATILEDRHMTPDDPQQALPRIGIGRYDGTARFRLRMVGM